MDYLIWVICLNNRDKISWLMTNNDNEKVSTKELIWSEVKNQNILGSRLALVHEDDVLNLEFVLKYCPAIVLGLGNLILNDFAALDTAFRWRPFSFPFPCLCFHGQGPGPGPGRRGLSLNWSRSWTVICVSGQTITPGIRSRGSLKLIGWLEILHLADAGSVCLAPGSHCRHSD